MPNYQSSAEGPSRCAPCGLTWLWGPRYCPTCHIPTTPYPDFVLERIGIFLFAHAVTDEALAFRNGDRLSSPHDDGARIVFPGDQPAFLATLLQAGFSIEFETRGNSCVA
jgi:hypothetical protein